MSKYVVYYNKNKEAYREFAEAWAKWIQRAQLTEVERQGIAKFLAPSARRFGLINEFTELGLLVK